jgi:hypothetical protein
MCLSLTCSGEKYNVFKFQGGVVVGNIVYLSLLLTSGKYHVFKFD